MKRKKTAEDQELLEGFIVAANQSYREGNPIIDDEEYDSYLETLKRDFPDSKILQKGVIEESSSERMEKLPFPMYSLEKVKTIPDLRKWVKEVWKLNPEQRIVITPKYDGISLLVDETIGDCWTRGDGEKGQASNSHYLLINKGTIPNPIPMFTFGEAIIPTAMFLKNIKPLGYKSARNTVAGAFNADEMNEIVLKNTAYMRYGIMDNTKDKSTQLEKLLFSYAPYSTKYWVTSASLFDNTDENIQGYLDGLFQQTTNFKCDGLVIEIDKAEIRNALGRLPNGNPRYAIAYKNPDWSERSVTIVKDIEWNVSKDGKMKPVIIIDPIEFDGATVNRATGYNAKYICDNHICPGAYIIVARSGDVIPKHIETLKYEEASFRSMCDEMMVCPSCSDPVKWDSSLTELVCSNPECREKRFQKLVYFFTVMGVENFGEPTMRKVFEDGLESIRDILMVDEKRLRYIKDIGASIARKVCFQFNKLKTDGMPLARLMVATNVFHGTIGERTCQLILDNLEQEDLDKVMRYEEIPIDHLIQIEGVAESTARAFVQGVKLYGETESLPIPVSKVASQKVKAAVNQMRVCFSGFRNKEWETRLVESGHLVSSGISGKTTHLVVKDKESGSSKIEKAEKLSIPILTLKEFESLMEWTK